MSLFLVLSILCGEPEYAAMSEQEVMTYLEREDKARTDRESVLTRELARLRGEYRAARVAARPAINDQIEKHRLELERMKSGDVHYLINQSPEVGTVGYVESGHIVYFPSPKVGLVRLDRVETVVEWGNDKRVTKTSYVLVAGLDSEKHADGQTWKPQGPFKATRVDRGFDAMNALAKIRLLHYGSALTSLTVIQSVDGAVIESARMKRDALKKVPGLSPKKP